MRNDIVLEQMEHPLSDEDIVERTAERAEIIRLMEEDIDEDKALYLITWSPDPKQLPDADFQIQHDFNVNLLAQYLRYCDVGIFCLESSQRGNPHYHGWYQVANDFREKGRIVAVKTLNRFGELKITECKVSYKVNCYSQKANALWYYKKDVHGSMMYYDDSIIVDTSRRDIDWEKMSMTSFFDKTIDGDVYNKMTTRKFCMDFYKDSMNWYNEKS